MPRSRGAATWSDATLVQRLAVVTYSTGELAFLVLVYVAFISLALGSRTGGYAVLAGITIHFVTRQLALAVFANAEGDFDDFTRTERAYLFATACGQLVVVAGIVASLLGWRPGAYVAVLGVMGHVAGHLAVGASAYRRVMARSWPAVPPLPADDD